MLTDQGAPWCDYVTGSNPSAAPLAEDSGGTRGGDRVGVGVLWALANFE